jgi:TonB-dependent SusC/RagA subfamily outer membrane receptor
MQFSFAQEKTVTGVVSDASGPLPGANVVVQGSKTGTQTDVDGKYSIKAKAGDVLVFSFVGMTETTAKVGASSTVNVKMQDGVKLEEVVVGALGVKRKEKAVGYAAQNIKGSALTEARESNLVNALSGRVGASSRIVLRGNSSITGNNQALFVVDGVPFDNSSSADLGYDGRSSSSAGSGGGRDLPNGAASISPDDIESMTILKGPNAAALYGLRASNGVVIITTKSGKGKKSLSVVSFNSNITFTDPLLLPNYQNSYGQGSTADYFQFVDGAGNGFNDGVDESWGPALDRGLSFVQWDSYKVGGAPLPWISHPNNVKDFYETGVAMTNNLSMSAGNEDANFRMSIGNSKETGMVPNTEW